MVIVCAAGQDSAEMKLGFRHLKPAVDTPPNSNWSLCLYVLLDGSGQQLADPGGEHNGAATLTTDAPVSQKPLHKARSNQSPSPKYLQ